MEKGNKLRMAIVIAFCIIVLVAILLGVYYITRELDTLETTDSKMNTTYQNKTSNEITNNTKKEPTNQMNQTDEGKE